MESYKYMIDMMNKVNNEYFKTNTPSGKLDGAQKDYDELSKEYDILLNQYINLSHENRMLATNQSIKEEGGHHGQE